MKSLRDRKAIAWHLFLGVGVLTGLWAVIQFGMNRLLDAPPGYYPSAAHDDLDGLLVMILFVGAFLIWIVSLARPSLLTVEGAAWMMLPVFLSSAWQVVPAIVTQAFGQPHAEAAEVAGEVVRTVPVWRGRTEKSRYLVIIRAGGRQDSLLANRGESSEAGKFVLLSGAKGPLGFHVRRVAPVEPQVSPRP